MNPFPDHLLAQAKLLLELARQMRVKIAAAESCTGGLIAALLTEIPGSSDVMLGGHVTYANEAKTHWLGVTAEMLKTHGAVSEQTARAMAAGMKVDAEKLGKDYSVMAIAVTGVAGPGGGTAEKPVGTVHLAVAGPEEEVRHEKKLYAGSRTSIRMATVEDALQLMLAQLG